MSTIDPTKLLGYTFPPETISYSPRDLSLYALAIGAGRDPLSPSDLAFIYEGAERFSAFPTLSAALGFGFLPKLRSLPGMDYDPMLLVHGEHQINVFALFDTSGTLTNYADITGVWDKGSGALIVIEVKTRNAQEDLVAVNTYSLFIRDAGGFGGNRGPSVEKLKLPDRPPDKIVEDKTLPQQALLYRLSGDMNPLHVDPGMTSRSGFERPILHGLCVFGFIARAALAEFGANEAKKFRAMKTRFTNPVFPGETLSHQLWKTDEGIVISTKTIENDINVAMSLVELA